jgi:hypothetical protein
VLGGLSWGMVSRWRGWWPHVICLISRKRHVPAGCCSLAGRMLGLV